LRLADYGKMLLREHRLQKFHSALKVAMGDQGVVCVDGLRFKLSVEELSRMADRALLIFLSCPPATRRSRSSDQISESEFDILGLHETEISVDAMKDSSDAIIDTSKPIADVLLDLESELRKQQFI
jgi:hypothetical protein